MECKIEDQREDLCVSSQFFGESLAVAGLLTEPPWLGQETGHSHPGLLRGYIFAMYQEKND